MKRLDLSKIIEACCLSFQGLNDKEVADKLGSTFPTISRWRKHPVWQQTEEKLIENTIEQKINQIPQNGKEI